MKQIWKVVLPALLASGCGGTGTEDFTIEVQRPVTVAFAPFSQVDTGIAGQIFPGLQVKMSRPSESELLYTIPGDGTSESTFLLTFEPTGEGGATIIHVAIDVPPVRSKIDGLDKVLSERKVEAAVERLFESAGASLERRETGSSQLAEFSRILTGVAIATNSKYMNRISEFKSDPQKMAAALAALNGYDEYDEDYRQMGQPEDPRAESPVAADPEDDARNAQYEMERETSEASEPDNSLSY